MSSDENLMENPTPYFVSTWERFAIPAEVSSALTIAAICLALVPLFAGMRAGPLEVPDMPPRKRWVVGTCGLGLTILAVTGFQPLWRTPAAVLTDCGFFRDKPDAIGRWQTYDPALHASETLWVGCQLAAYRDTWITAVSTAASDSVKFFVGYADQRTATGTTHIEFGRSERIAVAFNPPLDSSIFERFAKPSPFVVVLGNGEPVVAGRLPRL